MPADEEQKKPLTKKLSASGIFAPIQDSLAELDEFLEGQISQFSPVTRPLVKYTLSHRGKRLRPALVFFSGMRADGVAEKNVITGAAVVELIHLATLVHDDILDAATIRHASPTLFAKYGAHTAVLLGDAILAQALQLASAFDSAELCRAIAVATRKICDGEIWQTTERGNSELSLESYFQIIQMKTGELFEISAFLGATLGGNGAEYGKACAEFGRRIGRAYQIFDDLVDFLGTEDSIGKTLGTDFASGKYTLPMILFLQKKSQRQRAEISKKIASGLLSISVLSAEMREAGTFAESKKFFDEECRAAVAAVAPFENFPGTAGLVGVASFVAAQVENFFAAD